MLKMLGNLTKFSNPVCGSFKKTKEKHTSFTNTYLQAPKISQGREKAFFPALPSTPLGAV